MVVLAAAAIALVALIVAPGWLFYFDVTPKIAVLLAATAALAVWPRRDATRAPRWFTLLALAALASLAVSTALSVDPALSFTGTNWRRFGAPVQAAVLLFAWLLACAVSAKPGRARIVLRGVAWSGAAAALYGIAQYFGWDPLLPRSSYHIGEGIWTIVRPPGTLGYASYFATWLLAAAFLSLALAVEETGPWLRRAALACAVLSAVAMLLTGTRAGMLGMGAGGAVWLARRGFRVPRRVLVAGAALLGAGAAFYYSPPGWQMRSRARWFEEDPWGGGRTRLWRDSLAMAARRPLGYGPETFTAAFPRFESPALAREYPDFLYESPHNILLDAWVEQGIPGLAILALFCGLGFGAARRAKQPGAAWLAAALAAALASQMFTVFTMPTALIFYVTIALAAGLGEARSVATRGAWLRWPVALLLLYGGVRLTLADRDLELARRALDAGDAGIASARFADYDRLRFPGSGSDLWYSRACAGLAGRSPDPVVRVQALAQAGAAAVRATRTAEDPFNAWYNLSALYAAQNDFADTEKCLRAAIAARPNWYKPHWTLAQVLRLEGRVGEARGEAEIAAALDGGKHPEVAQTLREMGAVGAAPRAQPK